MLSDSQSSQDSTNFMSVIDRKSQRSSSMTTASNTSQKRSQSSTASSFPNESPLFNSNLPSQGSQGNGLPGHNSQTLSQSLPIRPKITETMPDPLTKPIHQQSSPKKALQNPSSRNVLGSSQIQPDDVDGFYSQEGYSESNTYLQPIGWNLPDSLEFYFPLLKEYKDRIRESGFNPRVYRDNEVEYEDDQREYEDNRDGYEYQETGNEDNKVRYQENEEEWEDYTEEYEFNHREYERGYEDPEEYKDNEVEIKNSQSKDQDNQREYEDNGRGNKGYEQEYQGKEEEQENGDEDNNSLRGFDCNDRDYEESEIEYEGLMEIQQEGYSAEKEDNSFSYIQNDNTIFEFDQQTNMEIESQSPKFGYVDESEQSLEVTEEEILDPNFFDDIENEIFINFDSLKNGVLNEFFQYQNPEDALEVILSKFEMFEASLAKVLWGKKQLDNQLKSFEALFANYNEQVLKALDDQSKRIQEGYEHLRKRIRIERRTLRDVKLSKMKRYLLTELHELTQSLFNDVDEIENLYVKLDKKSDEWECNYAAPDPIDSSARGYAGIDSTEHRNGGSNVEANNNTEDVNSERWELDLEKESSEEEKEDNTERIPKKTNIVTNKTKISKQEKLKKR